ncbi:STAS domain-containing protein [Saccharopolyspora rhizosphaerae]|uniref:STAS domain-containing protein n=1 Tax=Saccharopolyspora rhizosphaerae TaxID=2492662 RepID=UPI001315597B|nr:STAS domain-containing protein [Saccharopolyspora rhizosphaerae]
MIDAPQAPTVDGEPVEPQASALAARLWPHLLTAPPTTVLDLGAVAHLDAACLDVLAAAHTYAVHRGCVLRIINAEPGVHQELHAAGVPSSPAREVVA